MRIIIVVIIVSLSLVTVNANIQDNVKKLEKLITRRGSMQIKIDIDERTITLEAEPSDTVKSVKVQIQGKEGIPVDQQSLFYNNDELHDTYKLSDYNIMDGSVITLVRED